MKKRLEELTKSRLEKLKSIKKAGINPYPSKVKRTHTCKEIKDEFQKLLNKEIVLCGRIRLIRGHGKSTFVDIEDGSERIQLYLKQDVLGQDKYEFFGKLDLGDFIQVEGKLFLTKTKEKTLEVLDFYLISKALKPLPEKWHGLKDIDVRYRKRYLDLLINKEVKDKFKTRDQLIREMRNYFYKEGFIEVETPILQSVSGGATAKPFITHHNAYNVDLYLRIAPELYLKRLIVGGFEKVFEIGRQFRNEGVDRNHNPDFTSCEFYWAYQDYEGLIGFTEKFLSGVINKIKGGLKFKYQGRELDFTPPWKKIDFKESLLKETGINVLKLKNEKKLAKAIKNKGYKINKKASYAKLCDDLFKDAVRSKISQPTFVVNCPIEIEPLAKKDEKNEKQAQRFQLVAAGIELVKAYTELNDPLEQLERFKMQEKLRKSGEEEAQRIDMDYIEALEYGMPPTAGWGMGIDRFTAILTDSYSLREIILFPLMKPKK